MMRDVQQVDDPQKYTSLLAMIGQLSAALVAAPAGQLSDRCGRKPLVYASCVMMAGVYLGFAMAPRIDVVLWLGVGCECTRPRAAHQREAQRKHISARGAHERTACFHLTSTAVAPSLSPNPSLSPTHPIPPASPLTDGLGNGMFLSVDYALACDTLPSLESAAQGLGVWGVSAFLGSTLGPLIAAPLLAYFGWTSSPERYSSTGYTAVNLAGAVYVACAGFFLCFVSRR